MDFNIYMKNMWRLFVLLYKFNIGKIIITLFSSYMMCK